jgi:pyrimidine oxygenase
MVGNGLNGRCAEIKMTNVTRQEALAQPGFGLPSDHGGKDLGIFLPMANGGWILSSTAPRLDGSYDYNKRVALLAEEVGFNFIMSMAKWRGYGGVTQHWRYALDSQILMAALAAITSKVRVVATVHTLLQNPAVTAKMVATLDQVSGGRAGLNVVTGSYKGEFEQMHAWRDDVGHDERYDLADEWIQVIQRLWTENSVTFNGRYFTMEDCQSDPKPAKRPFLVCAGTSAKGMRFTADRMDAMFAGGRDDAELAGISNTVKAMAREAGRRIRTYTMMTLVIAETDAAAQAQADLFRAGFDEEACFGMMRAYGFLDKEIGKENAFVQSARSGFMSARIIGSAETVGTRLIELIDRCALDGIMLIFPDYLTSMPIFAAEIMPRIRAYFPERPELGSLEFADAV